MSRQRNSSKGEISHVKAYWTDDNHELFIDLCLEQISSGNKPAKGLSWRKVLEAFNSITGMDYTWIQLKNHWDVTKKHWTIWHKLVTTDSMKWDCETRTFGASEQVWDEYLQANPDAAQFRSKKLLFADKLDSIFDAIANRGVSETPNKNNCLTVTEPATRRRKLNNNYADGEKQSPTASEKHPHCSTSMILPAEEPVSARAVNGNVDRCYDAVESRSFISAQPPQLKLSYSIEECIKCLDTIEEVEQGSELYLFALDIFLKKEYREIFLNLKKSSTKVAWLERLQTVGPPLSLQ